VKKGVRSTTTRKFFPGYVLVNVGLYDDEKNLQEAAWYFIRETQGVIGFIGLVIPHLIRLVAGSDHRVVLPASALAGGTLLVIADTLARTLMAPRQLPVGALTAAIGVPLFLILMSRSRQGRYQ
jgi:hypothetical protein